MTKQICQNSKYDSSFLRQKFKEKEFCFTVLFEKNYLAMDLAKKAKKIPIHPKTPY